jgi:hypothetical protein
MLKYSKANTKLQKLVKVRALAPYLIKRKRKVYSMDLRAGHTCPGAKDCFSKVVGGKVVDGKDTEFRCYAASLEAIYTNTYNRHLENEDAVRAEKSVKRRVALMQAALPNNAGVVRQHSSGDFFQQSYFDAWLELARQNPDRLFYAYTKMLPFWIKRLSVIPENVVLTASRGGKWDHLIDEYNLRESVVVYSEAEAKRLRLEIDNDDSHAADPSKRDQSFALIIHGVQPKGSEAAQALQKLKG